MFQIKVMIQTTTTSVNFNTEYLFAFKCYESTEVDRRTCLNVASGTPWSQSSDTHQVIEIWEETSI